MAATRRFSHTIEAAISFKDRSAAITSLTRQVAVSGTSEEKQLRISGSDRGHLSSLISAISQCSRIVWISSKVLFCITVHIILLHLK